jgi:hypothetical protein
MQLINSSLIEYNNLSLFSRSLHQPYYQLLQECYDNKYTKENIMMMLNNHYDNKGSDLSKVNANEENTILLSTHDDINELSDPSEVDPEDSNLFIFDDLIDEKQNQLSKYFTRGRHNNINVFYISQSFFHLPRKTIRNNSNVLIFFNLPLRDVESIYHDIGGCDMHIKEFKKLCSLAWSKKYGHLIIDLSKGRNEGKYRIGINKVFVPETSPF